MHVARWQPVTSQNIPAVPLSESDIDQLLGYSRAQKPAAQAVAAVHSCISHRSDSTEDTGCDRFRTAACVCILLTIPSMSSTTCIARKTSSAQACTMSQHLL